MLSHRIGPGAALRGALGARTVGATAAATGAGAARRGAWGARTVRANAAAAVGPGGGRRGDEMISAIDS